MSFKKSVLLIELRRATAYGQPTHCVSRLAKQEEHLSALKGTPRLLDVAADRRDRLYAYLRAQ